MEEKIAKYISYNEAIRSHKANKLFIDNTPDEDTIERMKHVGVLFDVVRSFFGKPLRVNSFYRCQALNDALNRKKNTKSQHIKGEAIDIDGEISNIDNIDIFRHIKDSGIEFDQLILEGINRGKAEWVHVSRKKENNRREVLLMKHHDYYPYSEKMLKRLLK